jgi:type IV pilus assembly protein PilO
MAMQTGLENKPWWMSALAGLAVGAVIVGAVYYVFLTDIELQIARQQKQQTDLQKKIDEGRAAERSLPQFREEVNRLQLELDKLVRIIPTRRNTEDLIRRLRTLTEQGDFKLLRFQPKDRVKKTFYYEWPIQIALEGTYHNLALFFDRVSRFSRIINIEGLRITARQNDSVRTIGATFIMKTFLYIEPAEEAADAKKAADAKSKKGKGR